MRCMSDTSTPTCLMTAWHAHETELQRWLTRHLNDPVAAQDLPSAGIDTPQDVAKAEAALQRLGDPFKRV